MEIPKAIIVERVRGRGGPEAAARADKELPDKLDLDADAELLGKFDIDVGELRDEFAGQSPNAG